MRSVVAGHHVAYGAILARATGNLAIAYTACSSGLCGSDLQPNTVSLTNDLFVLDGVVTKGDLLHKNFVQAAHLVVDTAVADPGVVQLKGTAAVDFDLAQTSPAVNARTSVANHRLDCLNRLVPDPSSKTDIALTPVPTA